MSDTASSNQVAGEPFWSRVRTALGVLRSRQERVPAYGQAAMARSIGIKPKLGTLIEDELAQGWSASASRRVSMCLLVIELDRFAEYFTAYGKTSTDECLQLVMQAISQTLPREGDTCLRMGRNSFVVVLPDLPALMARSFAGKIAEAVRTLGLAHKDSHAGIVTISQGLAVTNPHGAYDRKFFEAAAEALKKAKRKGMGRLEGVDLRPAVERRRRAA